MWDMRLLGFRFFKFFVVRFYCFFLVVLRIFGRESLIVGVVGKRFLVYVLMFFEK